MRYCDSGCPWPATSKKHPNKVRLCAECEARYVVKPNGALWPKERAS